MFGRLRSLKELRKGLELALASSFYGIPEVLVVHIRYDSYLLEMLQDLAKYNTRLVVLSLDPEGVCEDCASYYVKELSEKAFPGARSLVNVKYFGFTQEYADAVTQKVTASC